MGIALNIAAPMTVAAIRLIFFMTFSELESHKIGKSEPFGFDLHQFVIRKIASQVRRWMVRAFGLVPGPMSSDQTIVPTPRANGPS